MTKDMKSSTICIGVSEALQIAQQLHKMGSLSDAEMLYRRVVEVAPDTFDALHLLGLICVQQRRYREAAKWIRRIISFDPLIPDAHNNLGNVLKELRQFEEAEACYLRAIELNPEHASAHNNLGVLLLAQRKSTESAEAYRKAVALAPRSPDFRFNLANALRKSGELDDAAKVYREVVKNNPEHEGAWKGLARTHFMSHRPDLAVKVYEEWLRLYPADQSIKYLLDACGGADAPPKAPETYIRQVFDDMAESFDTHLEALDYQAPQLLCDVLSATLPQPSTNLEILDAGCGTGLCGPLLRPHARNLTGVDLSAGMLTKAEERKIYDNLVEVELTEFLGRHTDSFDVIASADTLCYFGDLEPVFQSATCALKPGGYFGFTLEALPEGESETRLNHHGRYSHSRKYVEDALTAAGLGIHFLSPVFLRNEGGKPVAGHLVVAKR